MAAAHTETLPHGPAPVASLAPGLGGLWRYLLVIVLIPIVFYPLPFFIATSPHYEHWASSQWGPMLEYAYNAAPGNADVVLFGDSSAFIGIDPKILNAELAIRSLVLPDSIGSIPVTGDAPLRSYLAHNRPPKLLVLYFSPWNLDFAHIATVRQFEGEEMMLRHGSAREITTFTLHHPAEMLQFPFRLYSTFGPKMITAALHGVDRQRATADSLGHADYNDASYPPLQPTCTLPASYTDAVGTNSVEELQRRYRTPQTDVMVYLAPVPGCRNSAALATRAYPALQAHAPAILPAPFFAADVDYAHILPAHVPQATALFAEALRQRLQTMGMATSNGGADARRR